MRSDHRATLVRRQNFAAGLFSITFQAPQLAAQIAAGQFVMLEVPGRARPYLRRAYSVADADPTQGHVEFLVKTIGAGTAALEHLAQGSEVGLLGPLGNRFGIEGLDAGARVAVLAGGIGAAPFPLLLRALAAKGICADVYLGGRRGTDLAFVDRFSGRVSGELVLATDDGSAGEKGFVTEIFRRRAAGTSYARLFACGPMPMFVALARTLSDLAIPAEFSTEAEMGCGIGACLGCVIPGSNNKYIVSCVEGPIFPPQRVDWERCR